MKLIIDIPEKVVTAIQNGEDYRYDIHTAISQGTPLPKEHGDLIDRDVARAEFDDACIYEGRLLNYIPTVIPANRGE